MSEMRDCIKHNIGNPVDRNCPRCSELSAPLGYAQGQKPDLYERDRSNPFHEPCATCKHRHSALGGPGAICKGCVHYCA